MNSVLKGNFTAKKKVEAEAGAGDEIESEFERKALKRLGGSVAYVAKKKVNWDLKDET
jgi:hypothetical protein